MSDWFQRRKLRGYHPPEKSELQRLHDQVERGERARQLIASETFAETLHDELDEIFGAMVEEPGDSPDSQHRILSLHARAFEIYQIAARLEAHVGMAEVAADNLAKVTKPTE
jgi:hypothetical protein